MSGDPYATHGPILAQAVLMTKGAVVEFGAGWGSTPLLHALCRNRSLITMESKEEWLMKFTSLQTMWHNLVTIKDWNDLFLIEPPERYSVALVDCEPGEMRAPIIDWLRTRCTFVVVHDTEKDWGSGADYKYETVFNRYKYRTDYRFLRPYTTVVSDEREFPVDPSEETWTPSAEQRAYFKEKGIRK